MKPGQLSVIIVALVLMAQTFWLSSNRAPMLWDDSMYAAGALDLYNGLDANGLPGLFERFIHGPAGAKAPLICLLPLPFFFVFGRGSEWAFYAVELLAFALCCLAAYRLVRRLSGSFGGFIAVVLLCFTPLVAGLTRQFLVEVPLLAIVLLWHEILFRSEFLRRGGQEVNLGLILGFGLLLKITFPLFILGSILVGIGLHLTHSHTLSQSLWNWKQSAGAGGGAIIVAGLALGVGGLMGYIVLAVPIAAGLFTRRYWTGRLLPGIERVVIMLAVAYLVAGSWYGTNLRPLVQFAWSTGFGQTALSYDQPLATYIAEICSFGFSILQIILLVLAALALAASRNKGAASVYDSEHRSLRKAATWTIFLWLALPLAVFLASHDRVVRLTLPCLAAVPVSGGLIGAELRRRLPRTFIAWSAACVILGAALFVSFSFPAGPVDRLAVGPWVLWGRQLDWDQGPPDPTRWPHRDIVYTAATALRDDDKTIFLLVNQPQLNWLNLKLAALQERLPLNFDSVAEYSNAQAAMERAKANALLLVEDGGTKGPQWTEEKGLAVRSLLSSGALGQFNDIYQLDLPDHGNLHFYRNEGRISESLADPLPECQVRFGDLISLVGFDLQRGESSFQWRAKWKVERDLYENYSVYLHFADNEGRIFPRDHSLTTSGRGTKGLKKGAEFTENYVIPLTTDIKDLRVLRVGVYKLETLTKFPVTGSTLPVLEGNEGIMLNVPAPSNASDR
jgi:hypothetical protein